MAKLLGVADLRYQVISSMRSFLPVLLLLATTARAHEIGTTRVSAIFPGDGTYTIEVVTDATALLEKLQGAAVPADAAAAHLQTSLTGFDAKLRQRIRLAFDDAEARPGEITCSVTPAPDANSAPAATLRLTGAIPSNAHRFTWSYGWTFATYAFMARNGGPSANPVTDWLEGSQKSKPFELGTQAAPATRLEITSRYLALGFTHILPHGLDHMLFVLGIYLLSRRWQSVLLQVSAFTLAHSITLGLSMYGLVSVSPGIVEPMIALSIAYVAIENILLSELKVWRVALVFAFGLLHGMGFAGSLQELGLPRSEFVTALLAFNAGVEGGQLAVIGAAFLLVGWRFSGRAWYRARVVVPASVLIACTAIYWTVERIVS